MDRVIYMVIVIAMVLLISRIVCISNLLRIWSVCDTEFKWRQQNSFTAQQASCYVPLWELQSDFEFKWGQLLEACTFSSQVVLGAVYRHNIFISKHLKLGFGVSRVSCMTWVTLAQALPRSRNSASQRSADLLVKIVMIMMMWSQGRTQSLPSIEAKNPTALNHIALKSRINKSSFFPYSYK